MIEWYCQTVAASPDSTTDHPMAKEEVPLRQKRTGLADTTVVGDLGTDGTHDAILAYDIDNDKGDRWWNGHVMGH